jgi:hypothetical protein
MKTSTHAPTRNVSEWVVILADAVIKGLARNHHTIFPNLYHGSYKSIYGAYREELFLPSGKRLPHKSILILQPKSKDSFGIIKRGLEIHGLCFTRKGDELRGFDSLSVEIKCKEPMMVRYNYSASENARQTFSEGLIKFGAVGKGIYAEARGSFVLSKADRSSLLPKERHDQVIEFRWRRIPTDEIRAVLGAMSLTGVDDIRLFRRLGGKL